MAELVIYGRDSCGMCSKFKKDCDDKGLRYRYANIEEKTNRAEMSRKMRATSWFKGGRFGLPLVDVYGSIEERPSLARVLEAQKALPSDDQVAKVKKQFQELDKNKDGTLQFEEMKQMLQALNRGMSEVQVQKLFCAADVNQNGTVELDEFIDFVMHGKQRIAKIMQEPPQQTPTAAGIRDEWKKDILAAHNRFRKDHGVVELQWMDECYLSAKTQANACQEKSAMFHDNCEGPSGRHGQNIYWCSAPGSSAMEMVHAWYNEINEPGYDFAKATFTGGTGHFTQVVWKGTTHVGMALSEDGRFCVANYFPAGNVMGQFKENVLPRGTPYVPEAKPKPKPKPKSESTFRRPTAGGAAAELEWGAAQTATGKAFTDDMKKLLDGCPFPFKDRIEQGVKDGATVTVEKKEEVGGPRKTIEVTLQIGGSTSRMRGTYGGG